MRILPVFAQALAVVAGDDDEGSVPEPFLSQELHQLPHVDIRVGDLSVIRRSVSLIERRRRGIRQMRIIIMDPDEEFLPGIPLEPRGRGSGDLFGPPLGLIA